MANRRRLRRLNKKMQNDNLGQKVNALFFDYVFKPIEGASHAWALDWLIRRQELQKVEDTTPYKPIRRLNELFKKHAEPEGYVIPPTTEFNSWPDHLLPYERKGIDRISAGLMYHWGISENEIQ